MNDNDLTRARPHWRRRLPRMLAAMLMVTVALAAVSVVGESVTGKSLMNGDVLKAEATMSVNCNGNSTWPGCTTSLASGKIPYFNAQVQGGRYKQGYKVYTRMIVYEVLFTGQWHQIWWDQTSGYANLNGDTPRLSTFIDCRYSIVVVGYTWYASSGTASVKATSHAP